ncbi:hypothetical protein Y1Q_0009393 [Alligator mississippiensis]|uniref:Uncharacterized protein n=1 Tax=Alligator mississippiensis TaxID=8496 RepID=A0A151N7S7_ALLMI|nr:hypothetical protein Y1Q_0009393 [Alligator mississippiensis]
MVETSKTISSLWNGNHVLLSSRPKSRVLRRLDNGLSTVSGVAGNLLCRNDFNPSQQQLFRNQHTFREDFQMYGSLKTVGLSLPITFCYLSNKYPLDMATHETPIKLGWTYPQLVVLILLAKSTFLMMESGDGLDASA